jgi:CheY-like chemotaxis protein
MHPRILVIDDHEDGLQMLAMLLRQLGCFVKTCSDGNECVETASNILPHAVVLDLAMPEHDGFEIAEQLLRADLPRFELVAMSGYCDAEMQNRCQKAGFNRFLAKPMDVEALRSLVIDLKANMQLKVVK